MSVGRPREIEGQEIEGQESGGQKSERLAVTLMFDPSGRDRLERALPGQVRGGEARVSRQAVSYFEAKGRPLSEAGFSLRVEREGRRYRQVLELETARVGVATGRKAWHGPLRTSHPVLSELSGDALPRALARRAADRLASFGTARLERTTRRFSPEPGAEMAAVVDIGELTVNATKRPLGEITLELTRGPRHLLFDLALEIAETLPTRLAFEGPARRALGALPEASPESRKAGLLELSGGASVEEALSQSVQHCLVHFMANEACVLESEDPEGIHQMRVAVRRLRSALRTFRSVLPAEQYGWLNRELGFLAGEIGEARDWDVFAEEIAGTVRIGDLEAEAFRTLEERVGAFRARGRQAVRDLLGAARLTVFLLRLSAWLARAGWRDQPTSETSAQLFAPLRVFADARLGELHRPVRDKGRRFKKLSVAQRHRLRIKVKRLRYATEFFNSAYPRQAVKRYNEGLVKLQDALGYLNDVAMAEDLVARLCAEAGADELDRCRFAGGVIIGWHSRALAEMEGKIAKRVKRFVESEPFWLTTRRA